MFLVNTYCICAKLEKEINSSCSWLKKLDSQRKDKSRESFFLNKANEYRNNSLRIENNIEEAKIQKRLEDLTRTQKGLRDTLTFTQNAKQSNPHAKLNVDVSDLLKRIEKLEEARRIPELIIKLRKEIVQDLEKFTLFNELTHAIRQILLNVKGINIFEPHDSKTEKAKAVSALGDVLITPFTIIPHIGHGVSGVKHGIDGCIKLGNIFRKRYNKMQPKKMKLVCANLEEKPDLISLIGLQLAELLYGKFPIQIKTDNRFTHQLQEILTIITGYDFEKNFAMVVCAAVMEILYNLNKEDQSIWEQPEDKIVTIVLEKFIKKRAEILKKPQTDFFSDREIKKQMSQLDIPKGNLTRNSSGEKQLSPPVLIPNQSTFEFKKQQI
jgi:hypothetical protein